MTEENYPDVPKGTDIEEQVKPEETIDNKMEGGGDGGGRSSVLYWLCVGLLLAGSIAGAIAGSIVLSRESEVSQLESACLASETSAGKDVCAKQSRALLSCKDVIHEAIAGLESEWTKNLKKGNTKDWAKALMKHISGVKYGMYYYDQADFCDGLVNWLKHNDGFVGLCALLQNIEWSSGSKLDTAVQTRCGSYGYRKLQEADNGTSCEGPTDLSSPVDCFEPDPQVYYTLRASRSDNTSGYDWYGYMSHNYEAQSRPNQKYGYGKVTGQHYFPTQTRAVAYRKIVYLYPDSLKTVSTYDVESTGPMFLVPGMMLQETDDKTLTRAMWRFQNMGSGLYNITNRRSGESIHASSVIDSEEYAAVADTTTKGCGFCGWSATDPSFQLGCLNDEGTNYKFGDGKMWHQINITEDEAKEGTGSRVFLNNEFCIEPVTDYQRADVFNPGAVSFQPGTTSVYSTAAPYITQTLTIMSTLAGLAGAPKGIAALLTITNTLKPTPSTSQTEAIQLLTDMILRVAKTMAVDTVAQAAVEAASQQLNTNRILFQCNYPAHLASSTLTSSSICYNLIDSSQFGIAEMLSSDFQNTWPTLIPPFYCNSTETSRCPSDTQTTTARLGWDIIQVAATDMTYYIQEMMFLYAYVYYRHGRGGFSDCGWVIDDKEDPCEYIYDRILLVESYREKFYNAFVQIPDMLQYLRMNNNTLQNPRDYPDHASEAVYFYTDGIDEMWYQWDDTFFSQGDPQAQQQGAGEWKCWGCNNWPPIDWQTIWAQYAGENQFDMMNWSYNTTNLLQFYDKTNYKKIMMDTCYALNQNADKAMQSHIADLNQGQDGTCYSSSEISNSFATLN